MFRDFTKYEVFEDGRVYSYHSKRFLKPTKDNDRCGYYRIDLSDNSNNIKKYRLHRVVYEAIKGEIPSGMVINHLDENPNNNAIWNLEVCTSKENSNFGTRNERIAKKLTNGITSKQVAAYKDGVLAMTFPSIAETGRNGFNRSKVSACCRNCYLREGNNTYKGFQWLYFEDLPPLFYIAA